MQEYSNHPFLLKDHQSPNPNSETCHLVSPCSTSKTMVTPQDHFVILAILLIISLLTLDAPASIHQYPQSKSPGNTKETGNRSQNSPSLAHYSLSPDSWRSRPSSAPAAAQKKCLSHASSKRRRPIDSVASAELKPQPKVRPSNNPSSHPQEIIDDCFGTSNESAPQPQLPPAPNYNHLAKACPLAQRPTSQSSSPPHSLSTLTTRSWYKPPPQLALNSLQVKMMVTRAERERQMREKQEAQMEGIQKMEKQRLQRIDKKKERN
jgi:hypothetical protein